MRKIYTLLTLLCFGLMAQAQPQKVNYQAVAVNASGVTVKNRVISLRLSILDSSATGTVLYSETHQPTTDGSGQFSVYLSGGTAVSGTFSNIPWGNAKDKFLKAEADLNGGTNYVLMGVSQVVSVPYALQASSLKEGATIIGANGSQYTLTVGANGPVWSLTNPNVNFSCGQTVSYAGENYPTVQIGNQCWFQKNLNVGTMIQGANDQTNNSVLEKYCYNNDTANCAIFGGLYQWAEAVQYQNGASNTTSPSPAFSGNVQGMCPTGWHVPSDREWCNLVFYSDSNSICGINFSNRTNQSGLYLKTNSNWMSYLNQSVMTGNNLLKFNGLPCGNRDSNMAFDGLGWYTGFQSTSESSINNLSSISYELHSFDNTLYQNYFEKRKGISIRCLKD